MKLRPYQEVAFSNCRAQYASGARAVLLVLPTGGGKCLGIGTPVLRYDGTAVAVEDVRPGDLLMGPDSQPRRVLSTVRDSGQLYKITPTKGVPWVCNDVHVLTLKNTTTGDVVDIDLPAYLASNKTFKHCHKQFTVGCDFPAQPALPLDPYFVGLWYGDGSKALHGVAITKPDPEVKVACEAVAAKFGLTVRVETSNGERCPTYCITGGMRGGLSNPLLDLLRCIYGDGRAINTAYLTASRSDRLELLAGLIDSDGYQHNNSIEICQKNRGIADGVAFVARSLGLCATITRKVVNGADYWRVGIAGDCSVIPVRIERKRCAPRQINKDATRTGFTVESVGHGEYAGFELDGDGRFLLGDFTVTHNTVIAAAVIRSAIERGGSVLFLVHREELLVQSVRKLESVGCHDLRIIRAGSDLGNPQAKITIASIQTLTNWRSRFPEATLVIFDEAHHTKAKTWASLAARYPNARILGLTATPQRADGKPLGDIFDALVVGSTVRELTELGSLVPATIWAPPNVLDTGELTVSPLKAYQQYGDGERAVVFCVTVEHAETVAAEMNAGGVRTEVIHGTLPHDIRRRRLKALETGELQALTCVHTLTEGWDCPAVACIILARRPAHSGLYLQICGRGLRPCEGKDRAIILDLCGASLLHGPPDMDRTYSLKGKGIEKPARDAISQCPFCGSVFMRADNCPECGQAMPKRPVLLPVSVDKGLQESKRAADILQKNIQRVAYRHPAGWANQALAAIQGMR